MKQPAFSTGNAQILSPGGTLVQAAAAPVQPQPTPTIVQQAPQQQAAIQVDQSDPNKWQMVPTSIQQAVIQQTVQVPQAPTQQVWALTQFFFLFAFCEKIIYLPRKQINDPLSRGNIFLFHSSQQLPRLRLGPLKGFLS